MKPVSLLTDFGLGDHYVGVLHAVLARDAPGVERIDLGHQVPPAGDIWQASFLLRSAWLHLGWNAVVLAVVDPGVGGDRRAVAVAVGQRWLVAPDNGLAAAVGPSSIAVELDWRRMGLPRPSNTFHGRDLFAPAAARLARGEPAASIGDVIEPKTLVACPLPDPERNERGWRATILHEDRFGNLITNLCANAVSRGSIAWYGAPRGARMVATYAEAGDGEVVMLEGSSGLLELALRGASAAEVIGLQRGDSVELREGRSD
jgi:S-adenosylmethionine hydrolase